METILMILIAAIALLQSVRVIILKSKLAQAEAAIKLSIKVSEFAPESESV